MWRPRFTSIAVAVVLSLLAAGAAEGYDSSETAYSSSEGPPVTCIHTHLSVDADHQYNNIHAYTDLWGCDAPIDANINIDMWRVDPDVGFIAADSGGGRCAAVTSCYIAVSGTGLGQGYYRICTWGEWVPDAPDYPSFVWPLECTYVRFTQGPFAPAP